MKKLFKVNSNLLKTSTQKNQGKFTVILLLSILLFLTTFSLSANDSQILLNDTYYSIDDIEAVLFTKNGNSKLLISLNNYSNDIQITIVAQIKESDIFSKQSFDTRYNKLSVVLKNNKKRFMVMPLVLFSENTNQIQTKKVASKDKSGRISYKFIRAQADWIKMTRKERLAKGAGIRKNLNMIGQYFSLSLNPLKNSNGNKLILSFSGITIDKSSSTSGFQNKKIKFSTTGVPVEIKFIKK